jgi:hypothetical protein
MAISKNLIVKRPKKPARSKRGEPDFNPFDDAELAARVAQLPTKIDASDIILKVDVGTIYFCVEDREADRRVVELFKVRGLNIENGNDWVEMLRVLAEGYFERSVGPPRKWTEEAYSKLLTDMLILSRRGQLNGDTFVERAESLLEHFGSQKLYKNITAKELGKRLGEVWRKTVRQTGAR